MQVFSKKFLETFSLILCLILKGKLYLVQRVLVEKCTSSSSIFHLKYKQITFQLGEQRKRIISNGQTGSVL